MARYTSARVGGPVDGLITANSVDQLAEVVLKLWELQIPFLVFGGCSNVLISDGGIGEIVVLNRAREIEIDVKGKTVWAASGASFGQMARKVSSIGFSGLEWAAGIPGTVGGAVYGNAGAHGGNVAGNLLVAEILHPYSGRESWPVDSLGYSYRSSVLKRDATKSVVLSARFSLGEGKSGESLKLISEFALWRKKTQPPGASLGSIFKNPPGDYAGRLIELAGLKGTRIGGAEISPVHANFIVCYAGTRAADVMALIQMTRKKVMDQFGIELLLEIELIGKWDSYYG